MKGTDYLMIKKTLLNRENQPPLTSPKRNGRYNKVFKQETPYVSDAGIKDLIKKYPPKLHGADDGQDNNDQEAVELQAQQRKQLDKMLKIIDGVDHQNKMEREKILLDQFVFSLKGEEFMKNVEKLKELDFAEGIILQTLFDYKVRDEHD